MAPTIAIHQCLFCPQTFDSATEKDDHTLEHFAQETCTDCNQKLIRVGNNLYILHNVVTCIKRELKSENSHITCTTVDDKYLLEDEFYSETNTLQSICTEEIEIKVERVDLEDQPDLIEAQEPESHQSEVETNHESDIQDTSIINEYSTIDPSTFSSNVDPFMCTICDKTLTNRAGLLKHIQQNHDSTCTKFKCEHCKEEVLSQSALDIHIVRCKNKLNINKPPPRSQRTNKTCDVCNRIFFNKQSLDCHKVRIHSPPGTIFCTNCTKIFSTADQLLSHRKECFYKQTKRVRRKPLDNRETFQLEIQEPIQAQQNFQMENEHSLMGEMNIKIESEVIAESAASIGYNKIDSMGEGMHVNSIQELGTELHPKKSNENSLTDFKEKFRKRCEICCKTFSNEQILRGHKVRKHRTPDTIFCKHCARVFSTEEALLNHHGKCPVEKYQSQKRRNRACDVCGKTFLGAISLQNHKVRKHSTPDTMFCQVCAKVFSTADELLSHQSECRLKQKIYQKTQRIRMKKNQVHFETLECYLCKNVCKSKPSLRSHMQWNHVPKKRQNELSNDQKSMCTVCGKYLSRNGLSVHMIMHTGERPYKCLHEGCEKSFRCSSGRNRHMKTHTGERPYHCTINGCDKRFAVFFNFKQHKFKVHGISFDNQFTCQVCNKVFLYNYLLRKHLQTHSV